MKLGILGIGNMGQAILRGILLKNVIQPVDVTAFDLDSQKLADLQAELGIFAAASMEEMLNRSDIVLLAIKPNACASVFDQHRALFDGKAVLSIITGWSRARLSENLPANVRILRIMPNTPALVGEGMIVFEKGDTLTEDEYNFARSMFQSVGRVSSVDTKLMNAVTALSGSGPAYVYMFIEALADGGVRAGLPRDTAYRLAAQTVLGSAQMVLTTGLHPGELKDRVCSPGGTTIEAVAALEQCGFRNAVLEAVRACNDKAEEMSR